MDYKIVNGYSNKAVISFYLDIIYEAISRSGENVAYIDSIKDVNDKKSIVVVSHAIEVVKLRIRGFKNIILWQQGVMPEESFLRNNSRIRRKLLYLIDKLSIKRAQGVIMVSNEMARFYKTITKHDYDNKTFIMPCFSAELHDDCFEKDKYKNNVFAYVGGLSKWQCFEESILLFKRIQDIVPTAKLEIYTFNPEYAKSVIEQYKLENIVIDTVTNEELVKRLRHVKFGFVIRRESIVNNVATPTKLSSYLSSGVIPIYTNAIRDFSCVSKEMKYVVNIGTIDNKAINDVDIEYLLKLCDDSIDVSEIHKEYQHLFDTYYNKERYIDELSRFFKKIQ